MPQPSHPAHRTVVITGCSCAGKSTLLAELARRGFATIPEPGRRIVLEEQAGDGSALPWIDMPAFARRALQLAGRDLNELRDAGGWAFCDRGAIDAASALQHLEGGDILATTGSACRYHHTVFMAEPWPEIYATDAERRHGLKDAIAEYHRLERDYTALGYEIVPLPRLSVAERADFVLATLGPPPTA